MKKHRSPSGSRIKKTQSSSREASKKNLSGLIKVVKNISMGVLFCLVLYFSYQKTPGYQWLMNNLVKDNIDFIQKNTALTSDQKKELKLHFEYRYLNYIRQNTPESAIVLFPFEEKHYADEKLQINNYSNPKLTIMQREYVAYFLYPRKVAFLSDRLTDSNFHRSTHLAIVDYMGYQLLPPGYNRSLQHGLIRLNPKGNP